jgi:hypothetical protein
MQARRAGSSRQRTALCITPRLNRSSCPPFLVQADHPEGISDEDRLTVAQIVDEAIKRMTAGPGPEGGARPQGTA